MILFISNIKIFITFCAKNPTEMEAYYVNIYKNKLFWKFNFHNDLNKDIPKHFKLRIKLNYYNLLYVET